MKDASTNRALWIEVNLTWWGSHHVCTQISLLFFLSFCFFLFFFFFPPFSFSSFSACLGPFYSRLGIHFCLPCWLVNIFFFWDPTTFLLVKSIYYILCVSYICSYFFIFSNNLKNNAFPKLKLPLLLLLLPSSSTSLSISCIQFRRNATRHK